ncbi:DUF362 domain-containing protein [Candidatus Aminicenantes bacterium AC-335-B20]|jgi:uncharacterized protein (DUF362 family)|nr:DUF362 domain-containing protein [SCandidatus Aminicenantes bacterium Aminicenantia_JdfR_composite]MCP2596787.1 DUF362 domain-containing protein [Candidatus Aminicenantes bacterium AC-335-G13]MCP2599044.1 DUF362 domain-containing protein [Candidatus Aminicenantes bacterium AC-335-B20]MCP2605573.1 DUF362 domain-containing protein [Candidatus Aminicenantes bacterium AC-335-O07]MCP2617889.1 DUF362 domain-containing protein [Candidatus Aminicenantes bacterium AC-335-A11]
MNRPKVIIRKCENYDKKELIKIFSEGLEILELESKIKGKIVIKPNVVLAHPKVAPSAFTRPEFLDALLSTLIEKSKNNTYFRIIENSGVGVPTSRMFKRAGYKNLEKKYPVKLIPYEESKKVKVKLQKGKVHSEITVQKDLIENDFLIYTPKLKTNVLDFGMTAALKLNIGILSDKERMKYHTQKLPEKIVDLLEIGFPDFIVTDAIEIAIGGNQMTEHPLQLGIVIISDSSLAHDVVCAHILNLDPKNLPSLKEASNRGYGSLNLKNIEINTNISIEKLRNKTKNVNNGFVRVDTVNGPFKILSGEPYCTGGCQGIMLDWLYMLKDRAPSKFNRKKDVTVVIGKYSGNINSKKVILLGDCTEVSGKIQAKKVLKIKGCPPRHRDLILHFFLKTGVRAPLMRPELLMDAYPFLFWSHLKGKIKNMLI